MNLKEFNSEWMKKFDEWREDNSEHDFNYIENLKSFFFQEYSKELVKKIVREMQEKLLVKCECETGGCNNCDRLCKLLDELDEIN